MGGKNRELGGIPREGWDEGGAEPISVSVSEERAGCVAARAIQADASGPGSPGSGGGRGRGKGGTEGRGSRERVCGARAQRRGEERGGAGTWQRTGRLQASREPGGRRVRAPWGRNPVLGKGGGATRRDVGGGSGRVLGRSTDRDPGERIRSLGGSHLGPHA